MEQLEFSFVSQKDWMYVLTRLSNYLLDSEEICRAYENGDKFSGFATHNSKRLPEVFVMQLWNNRVRFHYENTSQGEEERILIEFEHGLLGKYFYCPVKFILGVDKK